jgi:uncharacterized membrane protein YoaK (UPF0700 family)
VFRHEGPSRSTRKNAILAAYLALVAGFVNASGFTLIGSFTSHVTGSVGRLGSEIALHNFPAAMRTSLLVLSFFFGAFAASVVLGSGFREKSAAYGTALLLEAASLITFIAFTFQRPKFELSVLDMRAAILCFAMGVQNSLVTRLSNAVIRTTHLTGVVTDLGIEAAQWLHWFRAKWSSPRAAEQQPDRAKPSVSRVFLLLTVATSFVIGSIAGASMTIYGNVLPMLLPTGAVLAASAYAFLA